LYPSFSSVSAERLWILNDLFVVDAMRGKGYGEAILLFAQGYCKGMNAKGLDLQTAIDNPAQQLYEKLGWVKDEHFLTYNWRV
jgi:GNAT superfamily N-acetyltransferase